jgi:general secretion pathway protein F
MDITGQPESLQAIETIAGLFLWFLVYVLLGLVPFCALLYGIFYLLTLPMRRNERVRLFLDLVEMGIKEGRSPEAAVVEASHCGDRSLGVQFHHVAARVSGGLRLSQALSLVPRAAPPQIRAMLATGERIGDVTKVLPACRQLLRDAVSQVRSAQNYLVVLAFGVTPLAIMVPLVLRIKVMPSFRAVFEGMAEGNSLPAFTRFVFGVDQEGIFTLIQLAILILLWLAVAIYLGGPRYDFLPIDWLSFSLPWRRKRLQRDFSAILATLLDSGVPETEAVALAGESTANSIMRRRAERVQKRLKEGVKLSEAIRIMDNAPEFHWRISNALERGAGFLRALTGWHEALDAKAFQLEQSAAQTTTTGLVLLNGAIVSSIIVAIFLALIQLINQATLW